MGCDGSTTSVTGRRRTAVTPTTRTNNGVDIPQVGFGVYQIPASRTTEVVRVALDAGYRHLDTARTYGNEAEVGAAIVASGLPREDVVITTKLNPQRHGYDSTSGELEESLRKLRTPYVDLFLLHWPAPGKDRSRTVEATLPRWQ